MAARPEIGYEQARMIDMLARLRTAWPAVRRQEHAVDMRALWRLAIWGSSATLALALAVIAGFSDTGSRRLLAATPAAPPAAARPSENEAETRRLSEVLHILVADRERLVTRIDTLERNLEDMTGSIKRQAALTADAVAASPPPAAPAIPPAAAPATPAPPRQAAIAPRPEAAAPPPQPAAAVPADAQPAGPERTAHAPAVAADAPAEPVTTRAEFGVDVGGAVSFDGLRVLWASTKDNNAILLEGLHPVVAVRENVKTKAPELRLIVGPLTNAEAAVRLCTKLSATRRYCQAVAFEGQRLAQADLVPERKPGAAPKTSSKPASRPGSTFR